MTDQDATPQPFDTAPRTPRAPSGCGKPLLVGCGVVAVLLVVAFVVLLLKTPDLLAWSLAEVRKVTAERLPPDLSAAERERLDTAFGAAIDAVGNGTLRSEELPDLQRVLLEVVGKPALTREEVERLTTALEAVAGIESGPIERPPGEPEPVAPRVQAAA